MPTAKRRTDFFSTEEGAQVEAALVRLVSDTSFNTEDCYSADAIKYPDNVMPFIEKHKAYLNAHPALDAKMYIANLRLKTRRR
jgi:hypothetical protein